jgi:hypothetical protein
LLLWRLFLGEVVESLAPFRQHPVDELKRAVVEATGAGAGVVSEEIDRVLALGALLPHQTPEGVSYAWAD